MTQTQYSLSFTTGAALIREVLAVSVIKKGVDSWKETQTMVLEQNALQARTESTSRKLCGEIIRRLKHLNYGEMELLNTGDEQEQRQLIWLSICRHYTLIRDFSIEVLSHQYDTARYTLNHDDYDVFFNAKADWHDNLESASDLTKSKARQVIFKMLRECGLLNEQNEITHQNMSHRLFALIKQDNIDDLTVFPGVGS